MTRVLILTVGGSHQPIIASIRQHQPDYVIFLCSEDTDRARGSYEQVIGEGKVLKSDLKLPAPDQPSIVKQTGLKEGQYEVLRIAAVDDLAACYHEAARAIRKARERFPEAEVIADYTGGTKSMSAGLVAAAIDDGKCVLKVVTGVRRDLVKVQDGTESVQCLSIGEIHVRRALNQCRMFLKRYEYSATAELLEHVASLFAPRRDQKTVLSWRILARAFDAWDRFDHNSAKELLAGIEAVFPDHTRFANMLARGTGHGFELVEDLVRNAQRRAVQKHFDDAIGRLYRAIELTAQIWLRRRYEIDTSNVDLQRVPEPLRPELAALRTAEDKSLRIGLLRAWDLIAAMPDDPLAELFTSNRNRLLNMLELRNNSLFAHGVKPITESDYREAMEFLEPWLNDLIDAATAALGKPRRDRLPQLPDEFPEQQDRSES